MLRDFKTEEGFSLFVEIFSVWTSEGESKNWEDWNMKTGKADQVLKSWKKLSFWKSQVKTPILEKKIRQILSVM